jgi:hypothetical protein
MLPDCQTGNGFVDLPSVALQLNGSKRCELLSSLINDHLQFTSPGYDFEEFDPRILKNRTLGTTSPAILLLAFYLPQFYPIPENDQCWGRGFVEWRQLPRGIPRFPGHYQPRIPRDLGFYNLTNESVLSAQIQLAKSAGIGGFAFYYYRFGHRRLLDAPLELLLRSDLDMPFALIWANEPWTEKWIGSPDKVRLEAKYEEEYDDSLLEDLMRHFSDPRYIKVDGRPLFVIYNPKGIPFARAHIERWRRKLAERLGVAPLIFMAQTFGEQDPRVYGLDGALEFPPHKLMDQLCDNALVKIDAYSDRFAGTVIAYDEFVRVSLQEKEAEFPLIKTAVPSWDNEPRAPNGAVLTLEALSPKKYQTWLKELISRAIDHPIGGTPIVAINAWNEWAEGAYLEPDVYYGASYLNATARAYVSACIEHQGKQKRRSSSPGF